MKYDARIIVYPSGCQLRVYSCFLGAFDDVVQKERVPVLSPFDGVVVTDYDQWLFRQEESKRCSFIRTKNQVYYLARSNVWSWFVTMTFSPEVVDRYDYDAVSRKFKSWIDHVRRDHDLRYLFVPELHEDGAIHFHGLVWGIDDLMIDSGKVDGSGRQIFNISGYGLGWTTATMISDQVKAAGYVLKYITKDIQAVSGGRRKYWSSRNLNRAPVYQLNSISSDSSYLRLALQYMIHDPGKMPAYDLTGSIWRKRVEGECFDTVYVEFPPGFDVANYLNRYFVVGEGVL